MRNRIYSFILGGNIWNIEKTERAINLIPKADRNDHRDLLLACRQIYSESRVLPWSLGSFRCLSGVSNLRRWLAKFPPEFRRAITSIIIVPFYQVGHPPLKDELLEQEWTTRSNLCLQDFPRLKRLQVQVVVPVSTEDLWKMVKMKPRERIAGNVCVTWVHSKHAIPMAMPP